jgi:hypothetical protein
LQTTLHFQTWSHGNQDYNKQKIIQDTYSIKTLMQQKHLNTIQEKYSKQHLKDANTTVNNNAQTKIFNTNTTTKQ